MFTLGHSNSFLHHPIDGDVGVDELDRRVAEELKVIEVKDAEEEGSKGTDATEVGVDA